MRDRADRLGEGLFWSATDDSLLWTDILGRTINRLALGTGTVMRWPTPDVIGWIIARQQGGFVAGLGRGIATVTLDPFRIESLHPLDGEPDDNRVNDAKADAYGRIWFGTMPLDCRRPVGRLYCLDRGNVRTAAPDAYTVPNGPAIAPDGRSMLQTDSALRTIFRYPILNGTLGARTPFIRFEPDWGVPDGMTFDAEGHLWVACWGAGRVARFTPEGALQRAIDLPTAQISNCVFAGRALDRMFVTSAADGCDDPHAGQLFEIDPGCRGLAPFRYQD